MPSIIWRDMTDGTSADKLRVIWQHVQLKDTPVLMRPQLFLFFGSKLISAAAAWDDPGQPYNF